jgi:hypothetical protein
MSIVENSIRKSETAYRVCSIKKHRTTLLVHKNSHYVPFFRRISTISPILELLVVEREIVLSYEGFPNCRIMRTPYYAMNICICFYCSMWFFYLLRTPQFLWRNWLNKRKWKCLKRYKREEEATRTAGSQEKNLGRKLFYVTTASIMLRIFYISFRITRILRKLAVSNFLLVSRPRIFLQIHIFKNTWN